MTRNKTKEKVQKPSPLKQRVANAWPYLWQTGLKLTLIGIVLLGAYMIYLDAQIKHKFEGQRWQVPVRVYSEVIELNLNQPLSLTHLSRQLKAQGYSQVNHADAPGEFERSSNKLAIFRRAFDFPEGPERAQRFEITVQRNKISNIINQQGDFRNTLRIDPVLIERMVTDDKEDRLVVELQEVPEALLDTLLLIEDKDFYFHYGVSLTGIARAFIQNIKAGRAVQGGSTLTQQLAKNMFLTREKKLWRKISEALMALILEYRYSKDQILEAYINEVYLGQHYANGIYGFGLAAKFYFGETIKQLSPANMALLIAQVKGPSYYDPWRYPQRALERRDLVLRLMAENAIIDQAEYQDAVNSSLNIRKNRKLAQRKYPAYMQAVKQEIRDKFNLEKLHQGVRIFTSFSPWIQAQTEQAVAAQLALLEQAEAVDDLQSAVVVTQVETGRIQAVVGDRESTTAGFNRALNAKRSIGSLVKPFIYLAAIERYEQYNLATPLLDQPITLTTDNGQQWSPKNYDEKYRGQVTLLRALVDSLNIPTVNLGMALGLDTVAQTLTVMGIEIEQDLTPAFLLGALELSPMVVNQLYLTLANQGHFQQAHTINRIVSRHGETLYQANESGVAMLSEHGAYLINYALEKVAQQGTARSLSWRLPDYRLAGKTGTSNDLRDSWFVGFDDNLLITTWIGRDDNKPMGLTGSSGAVPVFANIMKRLSHEPLLIRQPEGIALTYFNEASGDALVAPCEGSVTLPAIEAGLVQFVNCHQEAEKKKSWLERLFGD